MSNKEDLLYWYNKLREEGFIKENVVSIRSGNYISFLGGLPSDQEAVLTDIVEMSMALALDASDSELRMHAAIYDGNSSFQGIFHCESAYTMAVSHNKKPLRPALDDFAQMVAADVKSLDRRQLSLKKIQRAIRFRNAVMLRGAGAFCASSSLQDAHAVAQVLEKNAKAVVNAQFLGGCKYITPAESWLMRAVYQMKYAKLAEVAA